MTEAIIRSHGLEPLVNVISQSNNSGSGISIRIDSQVGHLNLRADCSDNDCIEALESQLGQSLPTTPNTLSEGEHRIYWLGPDEWLILTDLSQAALLMEKLRKSVTGKYVALNDVSGGQIVLRLDGTGVRDLLAKGCTLEAVRSYSDWTAQVFVTCWPKAAPWTFTPGSSLRACAHKADSQKRTFLSVWPVNRNRSTSWYAAASLTTFCAGCCTEPTNSA